MQAGRVERERVEQARVTRPGAIGRTRRVDHLRGVNRPAFRPHRRRGTAALEHLLPQLSDIGGVGKATGDADDGEEDRQENRQGDGDAAADIAGEAFAFLPQNGVFPLHFRSHLAVAVKGSRGNISV